MNKVRKLDRLRSNQNLEIYNLVKCDYTIDVVQHWLKYHWPYLEANHERNSDLHSVWIDLTTALSRLDPLDQCMLQMYAEGYSLKEISVLTARPVSGSVLQQRIRSMVRWLNGGTDEN